MGGVSVTISFFKKSKLSNPTSTEMYMKISIKEPIRLLCYYEWGATKKCNKEKLSKFYLIFIHYEKGGGVINKPCWLVSSSRFSSQSLPILALTRL